MCDRTDSGRPILAVTRRRLPVRGWRLAARLPQLLDQHVRKPHALALRQMHRELVVKHVLIELRLFAVEQLVALAGCTHVLQHHAREQTFELLCRFLERIRLFVPRALLQRREALKVGEELG
jgi:hypothetical protein